MDARFPPSSFRLPKTRTPPFPGRTAAPSPPRVDGIYESSENVAQPARKGAGGYVADTARKILGPFGAAAGAAFGAVAKSACSAVVPKCPKPPASLLSSGLDWGFALSRGGAFGRSSAFGRGSALGRGGALVWVDTKRLCIEFLRHMVAPSIVI